MDKLGLSELAIFGGSPLFKDNLHVGRPNIGNREMLMTRFQDMIDRRWLTNNGPFVQELEQKLAEFIGVKHCVAICNATIALEIAARALGLKGEVIIPSFTFVASAHALQWQGITPVFCDVDPYTHNINPVEVEKLITPQTTGILGVHVWGRASNVESLSAIAHKHHLKLIFDAAHAFACTYRGQMVGGFGDAEVFSFHATKFFNTFEGGAITTNNDEFAEKFREMRNFGFVDWDNVIQIGTNGKMSEVSAAMGLTSLESLSEFVETNRKNYFAYCKGLQGVPGIQLIEYDKNETNNYQYVVLEIDENKSGINRDNILRLLHAENVLARRYFFPGCHRMEPYRSFFPNAGSILPETERLTSKLLQLPTGTAVGEKEIEKICDFIRFIIAHQAELRKKV